MEGGFPRLLPDHIVTALKNGVYQFFSQTAKPPSSKGAKHRFGTALTIQLYPPASRLSNKKGALPMTKKTFFIQGALLTLISLFLRVANMGYRS